MKQKQKPMRQAQEVEAKRDPERKLLELAREAAVAAERLVTCRKELHKVSADIAECPQRYRRCDSTPAGPREVLARQDRLGSSGAVLKSSRFVGRGPRASATFEINHNHS
jgi:hypothetical protein